MSDPASNGEVTAEARTAAYLDEYGADLRSGLIDGTAIVSLITEAQEDATRDALELAARVAEEWCRSGGGDGPGKCNCAFIQIAAEIREGKK